MAISLCHVLRGRAHFLRARPVFLRIGPRFWASGGGASRFGGGLRFRKRCGSIAGSRCRAAAVLWRAPSAERCGSMASSGRYLVLVFWGVSVRGRSGLAAFWGATRSCRWRATDARRVDFFLAADGALRRNRLLFAALVTYPDID